MMMEIISLPSLETGETLAADVRALIELGERQVVESGL